MRQWAVNAIAWLWPLTSQRMRHWAFMNDGDATRAISEMIDAYEDTK